MSFRNEIVTGPGGKQILIEDPAGNVVELFEPAPGSRPARDPGRPERDEPPAAGLARRPARRGACRWPRSCVSGAVSAASGSADHRLTSGCCASLCVERRRWLDAQEFEDAIAACNLLPGPASTQLAIFCAWRLRGRPGALVGGAAFIVPGLVVILALRALFLSTSPPLWVLGAGAGAGASGPGGGHPRGQLDLTGASWRRRRQTVRWLCYLIAGAASAATLGPWLVLVLLGCGLIELTVQLTAQRRDRAQPPGIVAAPVLAAGAIGGGVLLSVAWVAFKVGALSYGGGFVIIP